MLATAITAVINGLRGELVRVEVDVAPGLPSCHIVGLPDAALLEARERVRGAIRHSGFAYPGSRITVNLAPAALRKRGAAYDLAIAVGILVASGQIGRGGGSWALLGELSLTGSVEPVVGVLPMVTTLARAGYRRVGVPRENLAEALLVREVEAVALDGLDDAARLVAGPRGSAARQARRRAPVRLSAPSSPATTGSSRSADPARLAGRVEPVDLSQIRGQSHARWALEVALAGGHNLLLKGPPGVGKTLLARSIPGLQPPLDDAEALEVTVIQSVAGLLREGGLGGQPGLLRERPFRAPHHTSSYAALVGGGPGLLPGEVTLAHRGVLFLDELAEFDRPTLDALRQPLEEGLLTVSRARGQVLYPARFQLVAAMNPCRCGRLNDEFARCSCPPNDPERYVRRVSGPLLDRIDMRIEMARVPPDLLLAGPPAENSVTVAARIARVRAVALERNGGLPNAQLGGAALLAACDADGPARAILAEVADERALSARGVHRLLRLARSVADLEGAARVGHGHVLSASTLYQPAAESVEKAA